MTSSAAMVGAAVDEAVAAVAAGGRWPRDPAARDDPGCRATLAAALEATAHGTAAASGRTWATLAQWAADLDQTLRSTGGSGGSGGSAVAAVVTVSRLVRNLCAAGPSQQKAFL